MTIDNLISLNDIRFEYAPGQRVLNGASLSVNAGDRLALVGRNGSGKSTLFQLIMGLLQPLQGTIEILGKPRRNDTDFQDIRGPVGIVFQNSDDQLFCPTVEEELAFGPLNLGVPQAEVRDRVGTMLDAVGLRGYEARIPFELSGGEKRLVALASVLTMNPRVLLLDEPATGLDAAARTRMLDVLKRLTVSMVVISHEDDVLTALCASRCLLNDGRIYQE